MSQDPELQQIRNQIAFGLDVKVFMGSPIGRYLTLRANQEIETALESMKTVDPDEPKAVRKLQNDIHIAENFLQWMGEAVTDGENAERTFITAESSD